MAESTSYGDAFIPVIESDMAHTADHPFCDDSICPCHEDANAIGEVGQYVQDGLMSPEDADKFYRGMTV
ncbi:MAG: hypothetical protein WCD86_06085 [Ktedonobacteraceae bacterium]